MPTVYSEFIRAAQAKIDSTPDPHVSGALNDLTLDVEIAVQKKKLVLDFRLGLDAVSAADLNRAVDDLQIPISQTRDLVTVSSLLQAQELLKLCIPGNDQ
ncbi:hypothetical protein [Phaeobacter porticola]|uniref:Uncharacterized protein n=1 Tax=Phaeobacter porticola TaxID=1844006 RepID=A0A1L3I8U9_9RHOB|nr:hypothetical protein [Phaeobacter porticola]APG48501.1 hypothetical protein PhaeoP97_03132 [Phaeobacter porticola]